MVVVSQFLGKLGCTLCCESLICYMWVPFPFHRPLLVSLVVFRNTQCSDTAEGRMEEVMGPRVQTCVSIPP